MSRAAYHEPRAAIALATARWDDAGVGQTTGADAQLVPSGAVEALITTNAPIYAVSCPGQAAYAADTTTLAWDPDNQGRIGIILGINEGAVANDSTRPVHRIPVSGGHYLHLCAPGGSATVHLTFVVQ